MPELPDIPISSFPDAESISTADKVTGIKNNLNTNFTFSTILSWFVNAVRTAFVPVNRMVNGKPLDTNVTLTASDVGARPDTWTPSAFDIGALPADGTAVSAAKLANAHEITDAAAGWFKFLSISMETFTRQTMLLAIESRYNTRCGILRIATRRNSSGTNFQNISWIAAGGTLPEVRWEYADGVWTFYISKNADPDGYFFQVIGKTDDSYGTWLSVGVSEPVTASDADKAVDLDANSEELWFTSVPVSAGTVQQIISISDSEIRDSYVLARIEWADPSYITSGYSWTTSAGSFTLTGTASAATTANILLVRKGN